MTSVNVINDYIAGAIGGATGLIVGHPFDTTKVQLQTQQTSSPYKNTWEAIKTINKQGMARGFFRGMAFPVASYGIVNSVFFGVYGNTIEYFKGCENRSATSKEVYIAGCVAGFAQLFVACPVEVVKVILQSQIPNTSVQGEKIKTSKLFFKGPIQCISFLFKTGGVRACYKGFWIQCLRDLPASMLYFSIYESFKQYLIQHNLSDKRGLFANLVAGGMAGVLSWLAIMPFDVVKNLYQADNNHLKFKSLQSCVWHVYQHHGIKGFYTGSTAASIRAFPVNAVTFMVYAEVLSVLNKTARA